MVLETRALVTEEPCLLVPARYWDFVQRAGGDAMVIHPAHEDPGVLRRVDALMLIGGRDVCPERYGQAPHQRTLTAPQQDVVEFGALGAALEQGVPVFGICRALQVINVALGGTLHQHLPDVGGGVQHWHWPEGTPPGLPAHPVRTAGWLREALGEAPTVNSLHHQGVDRLAPGLVPVAWAPDGLVEAAELRGGRGPVAAVQWHPELMADQGVAVLAAFLERWVTTDRKHPCREPIQTEHPLAKEGQ